MRILLINYEYPPVGGGGVDATKGLADDLARLLNDRALIRNMGERGRQLAYEEFRWDVIVEQYLNLFGRLKAEKIS
jgi:glycosyltransferase involved in cell wall biosynthesis